MDYLNMIFTGLAALWLLVGFFSAYRYLWSPEREYTLKWDYQLVWSLIAGIILVVIGPVGVLFLHLEYGRSGSHD